MNFLGMKRTRKEKIRRTQNLYVHVDKKDFTFALSISTLQSIFISCKKKTKKKPNSITNNKNPLAPAVDFFRISHYPKATCECRLKTLKINDII